MTDEHLWDYLRSTVPTDAAPIVEAAIRAVGRLPGVGTWKPTTLHWYETMKVVTWGIPFTQTNGIASLNKLCKKIGASIADKGEPDSTDLAEVDVAALLSISEAQWLAHVPEGKGKTPDFHAQWDDSQLIEVEVTRADRKPAHIACERLADRICEQLYGLQHPWDIVAYITDELSSDEGKSLLEAATVMQPGDHSANRGKWWLFAETINRPPGMIDFKRFNHLLTGWPQEKVPGGYAIKLSLAVPYPQVCVGFGVPVAGYINPVERKATWIQGSKTHPFVIAVDIDQLSSGYAEFQRALLAYLEAWPSVSAVLLFQRERHKDKFGWTWELYLNTYAQYPLPSAMLQHFPTRGERFSKYWKYTTSELV